MRHFFPLMMICLSVVFAAHAQETKPRMIAVDSSTIFKDSLGNIMTREAFYAAMKSAGGKLQATPVLEGDKIKELKMKTEKETRESQQGYERMTAPLEKMKGKPAPGFKGNDLDGRSVKLDDFKGKVVVLKFWFTKCKPCLMEMPGLNEMIESKYKDRQDVVFLSLCLDNQEKTKKILRENPFLYHTLCNMKNAAKSYHVSAYPTHFVIDKKGGVVFASLLGLPELEKAIDGVLAD